MPDNVITKKRDEVLEKKVAAEYKKPAKEEYKEREVQFPHCLKKKIIRERTYPNGVVKRRVMAMEKDGKMLFDRR